MKFLFRILWKKLYSPSGIILFSLAIVFLTIVWHKKHVPHYIPSTMLTFSSSKRTHCIGHQLIDVSESLGNSKVTYSAIYYGLGKDFKTIEVRMPQADGVTEDKFNEYVNTRRAELIMPVTQMNGMPALLYENPVFTPNNQGTLFRSSHNGITLISEMHLLIGNQYAILSSKSYPPEEAYRTGRNDLYKVADPVQTEGRLFNLAKNMRPARKTESNGDDFCMNDVLIDRSSVHYDDIKATYEFSIYKDAYRLPLLLEININGKYGYDSETLHERMRDRMSAVGPFQNDIRARSVRSAEKIIDGIVFQEWGDEFYFNEEKSTNYSFVLQNNEPEKGFETFEKPAMTVYLKSGGVGEGNPPSPFSLPQIESAWDEWTSSIRVAPVFGSGSR